MPRSQWQRGSFRSFGSSAALPFTTGLISDWDASQEVGYANQAAMDTLVDRSGNGHNATMMTANKVKFAATAGPASRPAYFGNQAGGASGGATSAVGGTTNAGQTWFIICKTAGAAGDGASRFFNLAGSGLAYLSEAGGDTATGVVEWNTNNGVGVVNLTGSAHQVWHLYTLKFTDESSTTYYVDGGAGTTFDPRDTYNDSTRVDFVGASSGGSGDQYVARLSGFDTALSDGNRGIVRDFLLTRYGL